MSLPTWRCWNPQALAATAIAVVVGTLAVGCVDSGEEYVTLDEQMSRLEAIGQRDFPQTIVVVDRSGHHLATVARDGFRTWIPMAEVPDYLRMAVVAT
ncbi:MAG: hypothetical protein ACE5FA_07275, partial [Dehalococcoidia bacterium]